MRKRLKKKLDERKTLEQLNWIINYTCGQVTGSIDRLKGLLSEQSSILSQFPGRVKDFATDPPIHAGEYIVWFIRAGQDPQSRKYTFVGGKWFDRKGDEMDIRQYKPSMYMMLPVFSPIVIEMYRRRG